MPNMPQEAAEAVSADILQKVFKRLRAAIEDLDMDQVDSIIQELGAYRYEGWRRELYGRLKDAAEMFDVDTCESVLADWEKKEANHGD